MEPNLITRAIGAGIFFLFIFLSGFWLSHSGKPYNAILFTIHKLIALAAVAFLFMAVFRMQQAAPLGSLEIIAVVITALFFAGTILAGGLLSVDKAMPAAVSMLHKLFPYLTTLSTAGTLFFLISNRL